VTESRRRSTPMRGLRGLLAGVLLLMAIIAAGMAAVELEALRFERAVLLAESAARQGRQLDARMADRLLASAMTPRSALQHELRARVHLLLAQQIRQPTDRLAALRAAREHLRTAARLRPSWAYVWAELAEVKAREGSFDAEFLNAFRRALAQGPHEARVLRQLIGIVLRYPDRVADVLAGETAVILPRLARRDAPHLFLLASRYHRAGWLCASRFLDADTRQICTERGFEIDPGATP
jgi:tetratricopeptide (TPR) repeat protein